MFIATVALALDLSLLLQPLTTNGLDALPPGALKRLGSAGFAHSEPITWVAFSPDGKTVITASSEIRMWDIQSRRQVDRHVNYCRYGDSFSISGDGKRLVIAKYFEDDECLRVLNLQTRKPMQALGMQEIIGTRDDYRYSHKFALSLSGRYLAVWDHRQEGIFRSKEVEARRPFMLQVWDLEKRQRIKQWTRREFDTVEFAPGEKSLVALERSEGNRNSYIRIWDLVSREERSSIELPRQITQFIIAKDGQSIVGLSSNGDSLHQFDLGTGKELRAIGKQSEQIASYSISPDGRRLAIARASKVTVEEIASGKTVFEVPRLPERAFSFYGSDSYGRVELAAFSPDGKILGVAKGRTLELWNIAEGRRLNPDDGLGGGVVGVHAHADRVVVRDMDMELSLWDLRTGQRRRLPYEPAPLQKERRQFSRVQYNFRDWAGGLHAISPRGNRIAAAWIDGPVHIFDTESGNRLLRLEGSDQTTCLAFSSDGKWLAGPVGGGNIIFWDVSTGKRVRQIALPEFPERNQERAKLTIFALQFSSDGRTLEASGELSSAEHVQLNIELATGSVRRASVHDGLAHVDHHDILTLSFQNLLDRRHIAAMGPRGVRVLDLLNGKEMRRFGGGDVVGQSAVFSPDGKYLVAGLESGGMRLWKADTGAVLHDVRAHSAKITSLAFADGGKTLVSGSLDGTAIAWEFAHLLRVDAAVSLREAELAKHWDALSRPEADRAAQAIESLADCPAETIPFLKKRLRPAPTVTAERLRELLGDLQSGQFNVRQRATVELERVDGQARGALEKALQANPPLEARRRLESMLARLEPPIASPSLLQAMRALEVLERIGTADARTLLESLATGGPGHLLTENARAAVERLRGRP